MTKCKVWSIEDFSKGKVKLLDLASFKDYVVDMRNKKLITPREYANLYSMIRQLRITWGVVLSIHGEEEENEIGDREDYEND